MLNALANPGAMIAQEAYWSAAFGVIILIDVIVAKVKGSSPRALRIVGAIVALGLVFVMANAYFVSSGVAAWCTWQTFLLYFLGDLAMGAALLAGFESSLLSNKAYFAAAVVLDVLAVVAFALEIAHFASAGCDFALFVVGVVAALVGIVVLLLQKTGRVSAKMATWLVFACLFVAVAVARYGFYSACVL